MSKKKDRARAEGGRMWRSGRLYTREELEPAEAEPSADPAAAAFLGMTLGLGLGLQRQTEDRLRVARRRHGPKGIEERHG